MATSADGERLQNESEADERRALANVLSMFSIGDARFIVGKRSAGPVRISLPSEMPDSLRDRLNSLSYAETPEETEQIEEALAEARQTVFEMVYRELANRPPTEKS